MFLDDIGQPNRLLREPERVAALIKEVTALDEVRDLARADLVPSYSWKICMTRTSSPGKKSHTDRSAVAEGGASAPEGGTTGSGASGSCGSRVVVPARDRTKLEDSLFHRVRKASAGFAETLPFGEDSRPFQTTPAGMAFFILLLLATAWMGARFGTGQAAAQTGGAQTESRWMFTESPGPLPGGIALHSPTRQWKIVIGWSFLGAAMAAGAMLAGGNPVSRIGYITLGSAFALALWGLAWHTKTMEI